MWSASWPWFSPFQMDVVGRLRRVRAHPRVKTFFAETLRRGRGCFRWWRSPLAIAFFIRTCDHRAGLQILLHQIFTAAGRALLGNRLVRRGELAIGIVSAAVEGIALPSALFDQVAVFALRTLHPDEVLLHVLALE